MPADLPALRRYISERPGAGTRELARRFRLPEGLAAAMVERLEARGDVERIPDAGLPPLTKTTAIHRAPPPSCAGCAGCFGAVNDGCCGGAAGPAYRLTAQGRLAVERAAARERGLRETGAEADAAPAP